MYLTYKELTKIIWFGKHFSSDLTICSALGSKSLSSHNDITWIWICLPTHVAPFQIWSCYRSFPCVKFCIFCTFPFADRFLCFKAEGWTSSNHSVSCLIKDSPHLRVGYLGCYPTRTLRKDNTKRNNKTFLWVSGAWDSWRLVLMAEPDIKKGLSTLAFSISFVTGCRGTVSSRPTFSPLSHFLVMYFQNPFLPFTSHKIFSFILLNS